MDDVNCIYIIKLPKKNYYKYGITNHLKQRMEVHQKRLKFTEIVAVIYCDTTEISKIVERKFTKYAKQNKLLRKFRRNIEIICIKDILVEINIIVEELININITKDFTNCEKQKELSDSAKYINRISINGINYVNNRNQKDISFVALRATPRPDLAHIFDESQPGFDI